MGIELREFHERLLKKCHEKDKRLKALYGRTCTVCGVQADPVSGLCGVCGRQAFQVERDPVPPDVLRPVDPEKAERLKSSTRGSRVSKKNERRPRPSRRPRETSSGCPANRFQARSQRSGTGPPPSLPSAEPVNEDETVGS
jgi:hypothetical protein